MNHLTEKPPYVINVPIAQGELTLVASDDAQATLEHSARLASNSRDIGMSVLVVNCGMSDKRFRSHYYKTIGEKNMDEPKDKIILYSSECGELDSEVDTLTQILYKTQVGLVILCGWEFASSSYRKKERLLSYLRRMMKELNVSVVVYNHNSCQPKAGRIDKGGAGRLSLLAAEVIKIEATEILEKVAPEQVATVRIQYQTNDIGRSVAQLFSNKLNELDTHGTRFTKWDLVNAVLKELGEEPGKESKFEEEVEVVEETNIIPFTNEEVIETEMDLAMAA